MRLHSPESNNTTKSIETCQSDELFSNSFETALSKGIEILDSDGFERIKRMLKKYWDIDIWNITFEELNWGTWVFFKKENQNPPSLWIYNLNNQEIYGTNLVKLWIIQGGKFDGYNWFYKFIVAPRENREEKNDYSLPAEPIACAVNQVEKPLPAPSDKHIDIKKWDSLWKIIQENYDIPDDWEKNRNIANIALRLSKLKENRWVIKDGTIFIGKSLFLPNKISTTRLPKKEQVTFHLKNEAQ